MSRENPKLRAQINDGEFIVTVQLDPPAESEFPNLLSSVLDLRESGITVFDINGSRRDCMSSFDVASRLSALDLEVMPHVTARDTALEPILMQVSHGYREQKINNVLIVTGDPYNSLDGNPDPRNIFQTKSVGIISSLDRELRRTGQTPDLVIAAAINPNADTLSREGARLKAKDREGADIFMGQPVFDTEQARSAFRFLKDSSKKPLLAGIWPFAHIQTVENIHAGKIKGVVLPEAIYEQAMHYTDNPEGLREWSFEQTRQTVNTIKEEGLAQGIYIVAPLRQPSQLVDFVESLHQ